MAHLSILNFQLTNYLLCFKALMDGSTLKALATLAMEGKYFAIRFRMRCGKVSRKDLSMTCDGKTVDQWLCAAFGETQFLDPASSKQVNEPMSVLAELMFLMVGTKLYSLFLLISCYAFVQDLGMYSTLIPCPTLYLT